MDRGMYLNRVGIPAFKTIDRRLASVRRTVVGYPKYSACGSIRFLAHDKVDQIVEAVDSGACFTQTKDFGLLYVPGSHVCQSSFSFILMLDTTITASGRSSYRCYSAARLNAGFFVRGDNKIMTVKGFAFPDALIQVQNPCSLMFKIRISRPNPASVTPGTDSIFAQPTPDSFAADGSDNTAFFRLPCDFIVGKSREKKSELFRQLASKRFDSNNDLRGKKRWVFRVGTFLGDRPGVGQRNACATLIRFVGANQAADRYLCLKSHQRQGGQFWRA